MYNRRIQRFLYYFSALLIVYAVLISLLILYERKSADASIVTFFDGIWYAIVTFSTVGYGDLSPVTQEGKTIAMFFILLNIIIFGFFVGSIASLMTEYTENKKLGLYGTKFQNHAVILGWNQAAKSVVDQLIGVNKKVAIVTNNLNDLKVVQDNYDTENLFSLLCEYSNYELLKKSNIEYANTVFINLDEDSDKLVVLLNLKKKFPKSNFVVSLDNSDLKNTFINAGARYAVAKNDIASKLLASYIFEPDVAQFSEEIMSYAESDEDHDIKEYKITASNPFIGMSYNDLFFDLKKNYNCVLLGMSKMQSDNKRLLYKNPSKPLIIEENDYLLVLTNLSEARQIERIFDVEEGEL